MMELVLENMRLACGGFASRSAQLSATCLSHWRISFYEAVSRVKDSVASESSVRNPIGAVVKRLSDIVFISLISGRVSPAYQCDRLLPK
jgi:hypothetical protein